MEIEMRRHSHNSSNHDICLKCWMSGLEQVTHPRRACRPKMSKRRVKKRLAKSDAKAARMQRAGYEILICGPQTAEILAAYNLNNWGQL